MVKGRNKAGQRKAIKTKQNAKRIPFNYRSISKLPKSPGIYQINSNGEKYIGHTNNLQRRAKEHFRNDTDGTSISYKRAITKKQASGMERKRIRNSCPTRNKLKPDRCKGFWEKNFGFRI